MPFFPKAVGARAELASSYQISAYRKTGRAPQNRANHDERIKALMKQCIGRIRRPVPQKESQGLL